MIKKLPEKLIGFFPPDYELDGYEVLEMINNMREKIKIPIIRKPSSMEVMNAEIRAKRHPERQIPPLEMEAIEVLYYAVQEMFKIFKMSEFRKENYSILEYNVWLSIHTDYDIAEVSFCHKIKNWLDGPGDGPGVSFYFTLSNKALLEKNYMR